MGEDVSALKQDLIGQQFERLLVISKAGSNKYGQSLWLCRCICGVERIVEGSDLKRGHTKSCGCLNLQLVAERSTTHGACGTIEYNSWAQAKQRCTNPNAKTFHHYGGRGIKFLFDDFEEFLSHIGPRPGKEYSLDRINNEGNYEPGNIRWATRQSQNRNTRSNRLITYRNKTLCVAGWAEKLGLNHDTIRKRLRYGWSVEKTLSTPIRVKAK